MLGSLKARAAETETNRAGLSESSDERRRRRLLDSHDVQYPRPFSPENGGVSPRVQQTSPLDDREQRVCRQGRDDRYAWPSDSRVIEAAASHGTARAHATRDCACSESAARQTWRVVAIADIQACGH